MNGAGGALDTALSTPADRAEEGRVRRRNPIFDRELLTLLRSRKAFALLAVVVALVSLLLPEGGGLPLLLLALLLFFGAAQQGAAGERAMALAGRRASDAMVTRFERLQPQDTLERAALLLLRTAAVVLLALLPLVWIFYQPGPHGESHRVHRETRADANQWTARLALRSLQFWLLFFARVCAASGRCG